MYSSSAGHNIGEGRDTENLQSHMMAYLEPMLVANDVDLALWGHVHKVRRCLARPLPPFPRSANACLPACLRCGCFSTSAPAVS